jgi:hypothetical protein
MSLKNIMDRENGKRYLRHMIFYFLLFIASGFVFQSLFESDYRLNDDHSMKPLVRSDHKLDEEVINPLLPFASNGLEHVRTVYVIPGGGGSNDGYPQWTQRRVEAAFKASKVNSQKQSIFLLLSAGSMNTPNQLDGDGKIVFECQHMVNHLKSLGVTSNRIFGDFLSWDTVANGLVLRMFLEGLSVATSLRLQYYQSTLIREVNVDSDDFSLLELEIFVSDFHLERVKEIFSWVLGLTPTMLPFVKLTFVSLPSEQGDWMHDKELFQQRVMHEKKSIQYLNGIKPKIQSVREFYAYLLLGGHKGYQNYLLGTYKASKGGGW